MAQTSNSVLVLGCDADGRIRSASSSFIEFSGIPESGLIGTPVDDLGPGAPWSAARAGEPVIDLRTAEGEVTSLSVSVVPMVADNPGAEVVLVLNASQSGRPASARVGVHLSDRERQILDSVADGYRVATIARNLFISPSTVRNHLSAIFKKLGVANQAELAERLKSDA